MFDLSSSPDNDTAGIKRLINKLNGQLFVSMKCFILYSFEVVKQKGFTFIPEIFKRRNEFDLKDYYYTPGVC